MMKKLTKRTFLLSSCAFLLILLTLGVGITGKESDSVVLKQDFRQYQSDNKNYQYLSDIKPLTATTDYKTVMYDTRLDGGTLSLLVDGTEKYFIKGIVAHANSTLVYDLKDYSYDKFTSYLGVDASLKNNTQNDGVKFHISVSNDNINWTEKYVSEQAYKASMNAAFVSIDIQGYRYLKLYADKFGNNWSDHATYGNVKLIKTDYIEDSSKVSFIKTVAEYDSIIKGHSLDSDLANYELTLLQRTFVNHVGYDLLQSLCQYSDTYKAMLQWLMKDQDALKLYLTGGKPDGSYTTSLKILNDLYIKHQGDLSDSTINSISGMMNGEVYQKMMITLSLTHTRKIHFWQDESQVSDPVVRYEIFKDLRANNLLETKVFDTLPIINMRLVFNSMISDDQIAWLNSYVRLKGSFDPYYYIRYTGDYNYLEDKHYSTDNYNQWDQKYNLSDFNIPYEKGHPKIWVIFEEGSVCGGLSKTGTNIWTSRGVPALVLGQPGHAAYMVYSQTDDGLGKWNLGNDVFGWAESHWTYEGNVATGWGSESWAGPHPASATLLSQAALNDLTNYEQAEEYMYLASVYQQQNSKDFATLEKIYNLALSKQKINYDAWKGLVQLYINDPSKTEADYIALSERIAEALTYYPFPMFYLISQFDSKITMDQNIAQFTLLKQNTLNQATKATDQDTLQPNYAISLARYLLVKTDLSIASFSFDGEQAGKIILSTRFQNSETRLKYSLDGGTKWIETGDKVISLSEKELAEITTEKGILVGLVGGNSIQTISITEAKMPNNLYNNDLENKVIGATKQMEWSFDLSNWTSFGNKEPDLTGNKTVYVRVATTGTVQASKPNSYIFNEDNNDLHHSYIPIKNLMIKDASSNQPGAIPAYTIDGNIHTMWHTLWNNSDKDNYITIELNSPVFVSDLQYTPRQSGTNGMIKNGEVLVSMDGVTWNKAATISNWEYSYATKTISFKQPVLTKYVRLKATTSAGNYVSATMINLFQDETLLPKATLDNKEGTFDLYSKSSNHKNLVVEVEKNSEMITFMIYNHKTYDLTNLTVLTELSNILDFKLTDKGYQITFLTSWLSQLEKGTYSIQFLTDRKNSLNYDIHVVDTLVKTSQFGTKDSFVTVFLEEQLDNSLELKATSLEMNDDFYLKFANYIGDKKILGNYDISLYDGTTLLFYDKTISILFKVGKQYKNEQMIILHEKNGKIESYPVIVNQNGEIQFQCLTGLSQFVLLREKKQTVEDNPNIDIPIEKPADSMIDSEIITYFNQSNKNFNHSFDSSNYIKNTTIDTENDTQNESDTTIEKSNDIGKKNTAKKENKKDSSFQILLSIVFIATIILILTLIFLIKNNRHNSINY